MPWNGSTRILVSGWVKALSDCSDMQDELNSSIPLKNRERDGTDRQARLSTAGSPHWGIILLNFSFTWGAKIKTVDCKGIPRECKWGTQCKWAQGLKWSIEVPLNVDRLANETKPGGRVKTQRRGRLIVHLIVCHLLMGSDKCDQTSFLQDHPMSILWHIQQNTMYAMFPDYESYFCYDHTLLLSQIGHLILRIVNLTVQQCKCGLLVSLGRW